MDETQLIPKITVEHDDYGDDFNVLFQVRVAGVTLIEFVKYGVEGEREEVLEKCEKQIPLYVAGAKEKILELLNKLQFTEEDLNAKLD
jgi:hypothetical protein